MTMLNVHPSFRAKRQSSKRAEKMWEKNWEVIDQMYDPLNTASHCVKERVGTHIVLRF